MGDDSFTLIRSKLRQRTAERDSAPVREIRDMSTKFLASRLKSVFEQVDDVFFDLADRAESSRQQTVYFDAMRMIRLERRSMEQAFSSSLNTAFQCLMGNLGAGFSESGSGVAGKQQLEIVDDDELEEMIALDTMVSNAREHCQPELDFLSERLDYLTESAVNQKNNPVGPEVVCDAFGHAMQGLPLDIRSKLVLLKLFDRQVLQVLKELIAKTNHSLIKHSVLPDLEIRRKLKQSADAAATPSKKPNCDSEQGHDNTVSENTGVTSSRVVSQLINWLNREGSEQAEVQPNAAQGEVPLTDLMSVIAGLQAQRTGDGMVGAGINQGGITDGLQDQLIGAGLNGNLRPVDQGVVRLIDTLFTQLGRQLHASNTVAQQLKKLELPILRVALQDHEFFDKKKHPARRLLNEIAQASMAFHEDDDLSRDPVARHISQMADRLVDEESLDNVKLTQMLAEFLELVERDRRRSASLEQRLLEQVAAAERVNQAHRKVEEVLHARLLGKEVPKVFVDFVEKAWCKVLFMDCLKSASSPEQLENDTLLLDHLLKLVDEDHQEVDVVLKQLLPIMRERLSEISFDAYQTGSLIGGIEQYFSSRQELQTTRDGKLPGIVGDATASELQTATERLNQEVDKLFEDVLVEKVCADLPGESESEEPQTGREELSEKSLRLLEGLRRGSWVEYQEDDEKSQRCKVAGIVTPPGKYIFVNRRGAKVSEKNRRRVALEIEQGKLLVLDNSHLFDDALETVIRDIHSTRAANAAN